MVCATCKGLQKHLKALDGVQESEAGALQLVVTSLPDLRASAAGCRACALLLQGLLLHHDRFKNVKEDNVRITAESFRSIPGRSSQDHLSLEARWKDQQDDDEHEDDDHDHAGWPDLKLEFFTDGGKFPLLLTGIACALDHFPVVRGRADHSHIRLNKNACG